MNSYLKISAAVCLTLFLLAMGFYLFAVITMVLLSLGMASAMRPLFDRLSSLGTPRLLAVALAYMAILGLTGGLLVMAASSLASESETLLANANLAYQNAESTWSEGSRLQRILAEYLPLLKKPFAKIHSGELKGITQVVQSTAGLAELLFQLGAAVVLSIYWTLDRVHFERLWLSLLPLDRRINARDVWREIEQEVGEYIRCEVSQSLIAGVSLWGFLWMVGFPYPALLAIFAAAAWMIPWAGVVLAVSAAALLMLPSIIVDPSLAAWMPLALAVTFIVAVFLTLELALEPRFFNRRRYNPLLLVLVVLMLAETFGVLGMLLGPLAAVVIQVLARAWLRWRVAAESPPASNQDLFQRVAELRERVEETPDSPELASLIERLSELVEEAGSLEHSDSPAPESAAKSPAA
ncbi:MAG: AI-2E family transporter [Pirellulales bacterium]